MQPFEQYITRNWKGKEDGGYCNCGLKRTDIDNLLYVYYNLLNHDLVNRDLVNHGSICGGNMEDSASDERQFIGRVNELSRLEEIFAVKKFEFGVIYGRRRVGKSTLLKEFIKGKPAIFLVANEKKIEINLDSFAREISNYTGQTHVKFSSFTDMMEYLFTCLKSKTILIIDEFTYLIKSDKTILSELQNVIDKYKNSSGIKFIISGSHVGMVEDMLSMQKPLYARKTFAIKLGEFDYYEAAMFYPGFSCEDKVRAYAVCGGIPYYLALMDDTRTFRENIISMFISNSSGLY